MQAWEPHQRGGLHEEAVERERKRRGREGGRERECNFHTTCIVQSSYLPVLPQGIMAVVEGYGERG